MSRGPSLEYDHILGSLSTDVPDLNLTTPSRTPQRQDTSGSDGLLDLYDSYAQIDTAPEDVVRSNFSLNGSKHDRQLSGFVRPPSPPREHYRPTAPSSRPLPTPPIETSAFGNATSPYLLNEPTHNYQNSHSGHPDRTLPSSPRPPMRPQSSLPEPNGYTRSPPVPPEKSPPIPQNDTSPTVYDNQFTNNGSRVTAQRALTGRSKRDFSRSIQSLSSPAEESGTVVESTRPTHASRSESAHVLPSPNSHGRASQMHHSATHSGAVRSSHTSTPSVSVSLAGPSSREDSSTSSSRRSRAGTSTSSLEPHGPASSRISSTTTAAGWALTDTPGRLSSENHDEYDFIDDNDFSDPDETADDFFNASLLSHVAVKLRDKVPRETHVKGSIPFQNAFTGKDIVSTIQSVIQRDLPDIASDGRRTALSIARSLQNQLFFYEVEWSACILTDGVEDVFSFPEPGLNAFGEPEELPNGIVTTLTNCYSPTCAAEDGPCYAWSCPRRARPNLGRSGSSHVAPAGVTDVIERSWTDGIDKEVLQTIPASEISRQTVIHQTILSEAKYMQDLDLIDTLFIKPLRMASSNPIIDPVALDSFIDVVFGNILDLRETNRRLLESLYVRQREEGPFIQWIGDIFLTAATEFRVVYPQYVGNLIRAEKRVKDEVENNPKFRAFLEECARVPEARRMEIRHFITRPSDHLQRYPVFLEAVRKETTEGNPDAEYLLEASQAIRKLSTMASLRSFQVSMMNGPELEWHDLVAADIRDTMSSAEVKRQLVIFELIKSEMEYVRDLELMQPLFMRPLRAAHLPLSDSSERGVDEFLRDIFHNYEEILGYHHRLLDSFFKIQAEEYPCINSIVAPVYDAALNWHDSYMEYCSHYPIANYRIEEAMAMPEFRQVYQDARKNPEARKLDMKSFINRPISRLLRYKLLLERILGATAEKHPDRKSIPEVVDIVSDLSKALDRCVLAPERKVQMWRYHRNLVWRPGEEMDLDLLDETRTLVHTGKLLRQPEGNFELSGWTELFVLLFDNYLVMTKPKEKDGVTKYHVNKRPIPLELLTVLSFTDPPIQRNTSILRGLRGSGRDATSADQYGTVSEVVDHRVVYPCSVHHSGRVGGHYQIFAESNQARAEWKRKLDEAIGLRKAVLENNKVFEQTTISTDTFIVPSLTASSAQTWNEGAYTGRVTCSVPLKAANGRDLVAVGCAEGVWIGLRNDSNSMRRVLHLKQVTQCAMLEDFGIFLVLADKYLFAYHIEALVPTGPPGPNSQREPQRLNRNRDVQFFSVGTLNDRTLIIYMKKKGMESVFRVLEPVTEKIAEKTKTATFSRSIFGSAKSEWFREYKEFFLPSEAYDLIFLKARVAILCAKGFEIMDLVEFKSTTIPQRDDQRYAALAKRCESCKPMGMFRSAENEFLLCYDEFGVYVDRHGDINRSLGVIEWEGTAERVAFHPPHILIFDSRFIEIRHIARGKLVQIIQGTDVHCTWDGRGSLTRTTTIATTPGPGGWDENAHAGEARIHAVMKSAGTPANAGVGPNPRGPVAQHVFELTPTHLLYAPPTLQPQSSSSYFQLAHDLAQDSVSPTISPRPSSVATGWSR